MRCVVRRNSSPAADVFWTLRTDLDRTNGNGLSVSTGDLFPLVDIFVPDCLVCQGWYVLDILGKGPDSGSFGETWVYD